MKKYNDEEYVICKLDELKFEELTQDDKKILAKYLKRKPIDWIFGLGMIALGTGLLVWAWLLSHNGIGYGICVSVLSIILFVVAWGIIRKPNLSAGGAIHGEIEAYRYQSALSGYSNAADYFANITFDSSKQRLYDSRVPEGFGDKKGVTPKENHFPRKGVEIVIFQYNKRYLFVYPECTLYSCAYSVKK